MCHLDSCFDMFLGMMVEHSYSDNPNGGSSWELQLESPSHTIVYVSWFVSRVVVGNKGLQCEYDYVSSSHN